jgi:tRNA threonylcarbamoyl adenosine modification protein (Sua5/YciO/YrdC/YwlC family)
MLILDCGDAATRKRAINTAVSAIKRGDLVLLPTESVYAIATDPFSRRGVGAIRSAKGQPEGSPLPLMVPSAQTVQGIASGVTATVQALMQAFWPGPMTLLLPSQPSLAWDLPRGLPVAVRMPIHPLTLAILERTGPMIVTAANAAGAGAPRTLNDAIEQLGECASVALDLGELTGSEMTSTVIDVTGVTPKVLREGALSITHMREVIPDLT